MYESKLNRYDFNICRMRSYFLSLSLNSHLQKMKKKKTTKIVCVLLYFGCHFKASESKSRKNALKIAVNDDKNGYNNSMRMCFVWLTNGNLFGNCIATT